MDQPDQPTTGEPAATPRPITPLVTGRGRTTVSGLVVEKIALAAAGLVPGVSRVGGGSGRTLGGLRDIIPGSRSGGAPGAAAEVGQRQAAVDVGVSLEYGTSVAEVSSGVRATVIGAVEALTGLEVTEVNVAVEELRLPVVEDELPAMEPELPVEEAGLSAEDADPPLAEPGLAVEEAASDGG
jgi:uncharacterized alkaline shock family protein YloU